MIAPEEPPGVEKGVPISISSIISIIKYSHLHFKAYFMVFQLFGQVYPLKNPPKEVFPNNVEILLRIEHWAFFKVNFFILSEG